MKLLFILLLGLGFSQTEWSTRVYPYGIDFTTGNTEFAINMYDITGIDLSILSPSNEYIFEGGTTTATITYAVSNFNVGATGDDGVDGHIHYYVNGGSEIMIYDTNPIDISVEDGNSYVLNMELADETHQPLNPPVTSSVSFSVAYPCDLEIDYGNIDEQNKYNITAKNCLRRAN